MGIYDRQYYRDDRTRRAGGGPVRSMRMIRMWSVTTWLIIVNVAIYAVDGFLEKHFAVIFNAGQPILAEDVGELPSTVFYGDKLFSPVRHVIRDSKGNEVERLITARPVFAREGGPQIGWQEAYWLPPIDAALHFSTYRLLQGEFWRLLGFQFLHANFGHLIANMIGLFFFGPIVEGALGRKRYLAFYLLCGIFGALFYCVLNLGGYLASVFAGHDVLIPGLLFNDVSTRLVGASAGVFGVLMAGARLAPNMKVLLFFILPMRFSTLAWALLGFSLISLIFNPSDNAGGHAGHLGGAIAGMYFIRHPHHLHGFFDILGRVDPTSHHYRGSPEARARAISRLREGGPSRAEIDRVLDKINAEGLGSLSDREKRILRDASGQ